MKKIFLIALISSCNAFQTHEESTNIYKTRKYNKLTRPDQNLTGYNIELFENTLVWNVAKAVYEQDTVYIIKSHKLDTTFISFQENKFGMTLLEWAVFNGRYLSAKALCNLGGSPNTQSKDGRTPLIAAATNETSTELLNLLIQYGGNVNLSTNWGTPLYHAAATSLENVQFLVKSGANTNDTNWNALSNACFSMKIEIVYYLILDCNANYMHPIIRRLNGTPVYVVDFLKKHSFKTGSKEENMRLEIINYINRNDIP